MKQDSDIQSREQHAIKKKTKEKKNNKVPAGSKNENKQQKQNHQIAQLNNFKKALLSFTECQICNRKYNNSSRLPLVICDQLHKLCLDCYNEMSQLYTLDYIQDFPKCPFCRTCIFRLRIAKDLLNLLQESHLIQSQEHINFSQSKQSSDYFTFIQTLQYQSNHRKIFQKDHQGNTVNQIFNEKIQYAQHTYSISLIRIQKSPIRFGYYQKTYEFSSQDKFQAVDHYIGICNAGVFSINQDEQIVTISAYQEINKNSQTYRITQRMLIQGLMKLKILVNTFDNSITWLAYGHRNLLLQEKKSKIQIQYGFLINDLDYLHNIYLKQNTAYFKKFDLELMKNK